MSSATLNAPGRRRADRDGTGGRNSSPSGPPGSNDGPYLADLTGLFPAARPFSGAAAATARRRSPRFDGADTTGWVLEEGLKRLDRADKNATIERWFRPDPGNATPLVIDNGCDVRIGRNLATGRLRLALLRWLPFSATDIAVLDDGLFADAPADALALVVRPPTIWSLREAVRVARLVPHVPGRERVRFEALERHATLTVRPRHLESLRSAMRRIEAQLPLLDHPVASRTLTAGCEAIAAENWCCRAITARQLARYATSGYVGCVVCPGNISYRPDRS